MQNREGRTAKISNDGEKLFVATGLFFSILIFRGSSAVERSPVKRLVVGSIPTPGARDVILLLLDQQYIF